MALDVFAVPTTDEDHARRERLSALVTTDNILEELTFLLERYLALKRADPDGVVVAQINGNTHAIPTSADEAAAMYARALELVALSGSWRRAHGEAVSAERERFVDLNTIEGLAVSFAAYASRPDLSDALGDAPPTLLVRGSRDLIMSRGKLQALARALPDARLLELAGSGHMTPVEMPTRVAGLIHRFLREMQRPVGFTMDPALRAVS